MYWYLVEFVPPQTAEVLYHVATLFAAFDMLLTPGLILYFKRDLREMYQASDAIRWVKCVMWMIGVLVNGFILVTIAAQRRHLRGSEHIHSITAVLAVCLIWAAHNGLQVVMILAGFPVLSQLPVACIGDVLIVLQLGVAFQLALDRFCTICKRRSLRVLDIVLLYGIMTLIQVSAMTPNFRVDPYQYTLWQALMAAYYLFCCFGMIACYARTYLHVKGLLAQNPPALFEEELSYVGDAEAPISDQSSQQAMLEEQKQLDQQKRAIAGKVLFGCVLMSSGVFICYIPYLLFWNLAPVVTAEVGEVIFHVSTLFGAFDTLLTPGLILYFKRDLLELCKRTWIVCFGLRETEDPIE
ncbi:hypothetical protein HDU98_003145 [Podochytrium sp. JEL0797]|nr:hypothetical protein HDU98_003145 [Podochytrium sp. JEL0797]